jgi:hypothetical protein
VDPGIPNHSFGLRLTLAAGMLVFFFISVGVGEDLRYPTRYFDLNESGLLQKADTIVVGTTADVEWGKMSIPANWTGQPFIATARLTSVRIMAESVIRGMVKPGEITVHYWAADIYTNAHSLNRPMVGERALHYLVTEKEGFRYVTDVIRSTTLVNSGYHRVSTSQGDAGVQVKIARILLTPGDEFDPADFIAGLTTAVQRSLELVGFMETLPLMQALLQNPNAIVAEGACKEMYQQPFFGQESCIDKLKLRAGLSDPKLDELKAGRLRATPRFKSAFLADPMRTAKGYSVLAGRNGIADFLHLIALHPDAQIARRARAELEVCCKDGTPPGQRR